MLSLSKLCHKVPHLGELLQGHVLGPVGQVRRVWRGSGKMGLNLCVGLLQTLQLTNFQQFHVVLSGLLQLQNLDNRLMIGQKDQTGCVLLLVASFLSVEPISWNVGVCRLVAVLQLTQLILWWVRLLSQPDQLECNSILQRECNWSSWNAKECNAIAVGWFGCFCSTVAQLVAAHNSFAIMQQAQLEYKRASWNARDSKLVDSAAFAPRLLSWWLHTTALPALSKPRVFQINQQDIETPIETLYPLIKLQYSI